MEILLLYTLRVTMRERNRTCWKSQETLALEMCCKPRSVQRAISGLRRKGLITIGKKRRKNGFPVNLYRIAFPWPNDEDTPSMCDKNDVHVCDKNNPLVCAKNDVLIKQVNQGNQTANSSADKQGEKHNTIDHAEIPLEASDDLLENIYSANGGVPEPIDLTKTENPVFDGFNRYFSVFRDRTDFDKKSVPKWYDDQVRQFWQTHYPKLWGTKTTPSGGAEWMVVRAGRAGALHRLGFSPKLPEAEAKKKGLKDFILRNPVKDYLQYTQEEAFDPALQMQDEKELLDSFKGFVRDLSEQAGTKNLQEIKRFCAKRVGEIREKQEHAKAEADRHFETLFADGE
jgi:hypothetical protein